MTFQLALDTEATLLEELNRNEKSLAITLDSIADGVISTDVAGRIVNMNRVAQKLTGWRLQDARERNLSEVFRLVDNESGAHLENPFEAVMSSGIVGTLAPDTCLISRSGERFLIEDSTAPIRGQDNEPPSGIVLVFRDITERKKLEVEFQQAKKLEVVGRLAGGIAHDFNNLLAGIMGYSERLVSELRHEPKLRGYARSVLETAERAAKLTAQLLAFSRKGKMVSKPVDMHECINSAVKLLETTGDRRILIETQLDASPSTILGDPTLLQSALLNLGINARDATSAGGVISITTNNLVLEEDYISRNSLNVPPGNYLEVICSDTGSGMTEEAREHMYEPFFTTKELGQGTGLGLAAVHGTVKTHGGAIMVESRLGLGTCFTIYLPLCEQAMSDQKQDELQSYRGSGCVLVVDDEHFIRETIGNMLEQVGHEVLLAENGPEALEIFKREKGRIKFVILDVVMPKLSGPETFFALREIDPEIQVIFLSGYTFENGARELLDEGAFGFIQKPFRKDALYKLLRKKDGGWGEARTGVQRV